MGSVWKRLQRVNKRAAKFQFTASYHELHLETTAKWRPSNLAVVWTRRSRRVASAPLPWEPDMMNPLVGHIAWPVPDNHSISVTLFKDPRTHELEDKDWTFVIEDITPLGKKRVLASASMNMRKYASIESTQQSFTISLKPVSRKITSANLELTIHCVFLREGKATDEDMQSVVSMMSVNNNCDVAPLDDLEDIPDLESSNGDISDHLFDFTQQLEQMTTSLNGCIDLPTPMSDKQNSEVDDLLKTPSATQPQLSLENKTITTEDKTPAKQEQTIVQTTKKDKSLFKFVTSTPIDKTLEEKPSEITSNVSSAVGNNGARRGLNFKGAFETEPKQNGEAIKVGENEQEPSKVILEAENKLSGTTKTANRQQQEDSLLDQTYTEKSTITTTAKISLENTNTNTNTTDDSKQKISNVLNKSNNITIITTPSQPKSTPPTTIESKRADLQPLNLKKNYDNEISNNIFTTKTTTNNNSNNSISLNNTSLKPIEKIILKENTPGQDLLEWCKEVTLDYPNVKVTNLTTSWRNGMAFCAIIHHFEPSLVDMSKLSAHDVVGNCRSAFDAAESLGIPRVIEPRDMSLLAVPDKLAVMTYLHQLRAHFTGKQLQIEQIGPTSDESSYVIGNYKSDNLSQNLLNLSHLKAQLLHQNSFDEDIYGIDKPQLSPIAKKDVKNLIFSGSKSILEKVLSPTKDKNSINASQHSNLSNLAIEATDTNGTADDVEKFNTLQQEQVSLPTTPTILDPNAANRILSRHKEMSEKAKMMMGKTKFSNGERNETEDERQQRLHEQARRLILETRIKTNAYGGGSSNYDNPTTPTKLKRINFSPERTISPIHNGYEDFGVSVSGSGTPKLLQSPVKKITPPRDIDTTSNYNNSNSKISPSHRLSERYNGSSPLQSFNAVMERISPKCGDRRSDKLSYIETELEALEREQEAIDQKASNLEKKLRAVMGGNPSNNRINRNPFIRLIRNSIGGGDSIRIKLLPIENDTDFFLTASGDILSTASSSVSSSSSSGDENNVDANGVKRRQRQHKRQHHVNQSSLSPTSATQHRPRSHSCIVDTNQNHQNSTLTNAHHPYSIMSPVSSNHSSCDNLKVPYSVEENVMARQRSGRARRRTQSHSVAASGGSCRGGSVRGESEETEEQLLSQWFTLVNKKNALLRRQMQLNILEQESDLERKYTMLNQELRAAQSVEDWRKTEVQREKERLLLEELVAIVDKRDQLVQRLHNEEIAIEDDHEIARELEQVDISGGKEKCSIQ